jgi:hypothetical protein
MFVSCECCVLLGRGLCDRLIPHPGESYWVWSVWVWSRILDNEEALAHWGVLSNGKKYEYTLHCVTNGNYLFAQECQKHKEKRKKLSDNFSVPTTCTRRSKGLQKEQRLTAVHWKWEQFWSGVLYLGLIGLYFSASSNWVRLEWWVSWTHKIWNLGKYICSGVYRQCQKSATLRKIKESNNHACWCRYICTQNETAMRRVPFRSTWIHYSFVLQRLSSIADS